MDSSISDVDAGDSTTDSLIVHDEIEGEVLNEEGAVISQGPAEESMQHGVSSSVSHRAGTIRLLYDNLSLTFAVLSGLSSEGPLVDLPLLGSGKGQSVGFQFQDGFGCLTTHVVDGILVSQPIASLNCVVCMPSPVVIVHIAQSRIDPALSRYCVRPGRKQLRNAGRFEALLNKSKSSSESSPASSNNDGIKCVINDGVLLEEYILGDFRSTSASLSRWELPKTEKRLQFCLKRDRPGLVTVFIID